MALSHGRSRQSETLPRALIIRRRSILAAGRERGRRYPGKWILLNIVPRDVVPARVPDLTSQVAFLTPKRLGPAHQRNKIRRRMREIYRRYLASRLVQESKTIPYQIWVARPGAALAEFTELKKGMMDLFTKWQNQASGGRPPPS